MPIPEVLPSVAGRELRTKLKEARENAGRTRNDVARALDWSVTKLLRIENGDVRITTTDLRALTREYQIGDEEIDRLVELARISRRPTLGSEYRDVMTKEFNRWLEFEMNAKYIRQYESKLLPGILQDDEYAKSVVTAYSNGVTKAAIARIVEARLKRAAYLLRRDGPSMWFVIDEAALRRGVGNSPTDVSFSVMLQTLRNLKRLNTVGRARRGEKIEDELNPNVSIQVMPLAYGIYPALRGPFEVLDFANPGHDYMLYEENPREDFVLQDSATEIDEYLKKFKWLEATTPEPELTNDLIDEIIDLMEKGRNGVSG